LSSGRWLKRRQRHPAAAPPCRTCANDDAVDRVARRIGDPASECKRSGTCMYECASLLRESAQRWPHLKVTQIVAFSCT
jgi:hypothetical protein